MIAEQAFGTSMDGVPATTGMHFRNGAVAFAYLATLLLRSPLWPFRRHEAMAEAG